MQETDGKIVAAGTYSASFALARYDTNGVLDGTFGSGGLVITPVGAYGTLNGYAVANAVWTQFGNGTIQNPDRIVVAGSADISFGLNGFGVARYSLSGVLDATFGNGGTVTNLFGSPNPFSGSYGQSVVVQGFGNRPRTITVGGYVRDSSGYSYFAAARLNGDGTFDSTFGTNGTGRIIFVPGADGGQVNTMTLQANQIVLVGLAGGNATQPVFAAARLTSGGLPDGTFGTDGVVTVDTDLGSSARAAAIQPDGKIVAAGAADSAASTHFALARYGPDGSLDASFGTNGLMTIAVGGTNGVANALALQPDGKIVTAGYESSGATRNFAIARCNADGSPDTTFGAAGNVVTSVGTSSNAAEAIALQSDGKLVAAGYGFSGSSRVFALVRYNTNGTPDSTFGGAGIALTGVGSGGAGVSAVAIQSDGKIVAAGRALVGANTNFALVRYTTNGALDNAFGSFGRVTTDFVALSVRRLAAGTGE